MINIPFYVEKIIKKLESCGFRAYAVGGCVRDSLQGTEPHDWDVCTSARPEKVIEIFSEMNVVPTGIKHGTVTVFDDGNPVEITTFRTEGGYADGRRPDSVAFVLDVKEDLARRDFTVNAMAYISSEGIIDPFGGRRDLEAGILRCVGDAEQRFREDGLRVLRGLRFMSQKGLRADKETENAIRSCYRMLANVSQERISEEFLKFMCGDGAAELLDEYKEVFCFIIPELEAMIGFDQRSPYHNRDVWHHTLCAVADIPPEPVFRLTMLLHDIAKPVVCIIDDNGRGRFLGHPVRGSEMAEEILKRMKYPTDTVRHVATLVRYHDVKIKPEKTDVKKWLSKIGPEIFDELMYVRHADASGKYEKYLGEAEAKNAALASIRDEIIEAGECFSLPALAVNGSDVMSAGFKGRQTGEALQKLLSLVIEDRVPNEKAQLMEVLRSADRKE